MTLAARKRVFAFYSVKTFFLLSCHFSLKVAAQNLFRFISISFTPMSSFLKLIYLNAFLSGINNAFVEPISYMALYQ
jgi:hypothetical protein